MAKKPKVQTLPPKRKPKGPPHAHMMGGMTERDMPPGMMAGRGRAKKKAKA